VTERPAGRRWPSNDTLLSMAALVLSLCAVLTTVWQTSLMRQQLRLSVWPKVRVDTRFRTDQGEEFFHIKVANLGVGPAIIQKVTVNYRGERYDNLGQVWRKVLAENNAAPARSTEINSFGGGEVLVPQQTVVLLEASGSTPSTADMFRRARPHLRITVRYASIYGEVWETGSPDTSARRVGWVEDP
jgi:hypothetical protein